MGELTGITNLRPSASPARLPALAAPNLSTEYLAQIKEILEVLTGRRGSPWDRAVTFRDLQEGGLGAYLPGGAAASLAMFNPGTGQILVNGSNPIDIDAAVRESSAYRDLLQRIGSVEDLTGFPEQIRQQLQQTIEEVARERGAAIRNVEYRIENQDVAISHRLEEITASLEQTAAGVRQFNSAYADEMRAVAVRVTQLAAQLEAGGGGVEIEERLTAISDAVDGLQGQWSLKIQTNPTAGQPPVIAGIALSVDDPIAGPGTSSLVFMAEKFGFLTNNGTATPFTIVNNKITFNGEVRINGSLVIGATGLQPGYEAPGTKNSEAAFSALYKWEFRNSLDGWSVVNAASATLNADSFTLTATGSDPIIRSPIGINFSGGTYPLVRACIKRLAGTGWDGNLFFATTALPNEGQGGSGYIPDPTKLNEWAIAEWDMSKNVAWAGGTVTYFRPDMGLTAADKFEIDWVMVGKLGAAVSISEYDAAKAAADAANAALPGINTAIADKLSKTSANILQAPIALSTGGAIQIGTATWVQGQNATGTGIVISPAGIAGMAGGVPKFYITSTGNAVFAGEMVAAYGTFGALSIAPGGFIAQGFNGTWNWSNKAPGPGFLIHPNGMLFGDANDANMGYVQINATGEMSMPGFSYAGRQLTLSNPVIVNPTMSNPKISTTFSVSVPQVDNTGLATTGSVDTYISASISNGVGPYQYTWTVSGALITMVSDPGAATCIVRTSGNNNQWRYGYASVTVKDLGTGMTYSDSGVIRIQHGTGPEP